MGGGFADGLISWGLAVEYSLSSDRVSSNEGNFSPALSIGYCCERECRCDEGGKDNRVGVGPMTVIVVIASLRR